MNKKWPWIIDTKDNSYDSTVSWPKISIITPSFNQGQYIEETILSVINQNYPNLEYIIIDGGSTDNSVEIIKKYKRHLTYWVSEKDNGQSEAINKGFKKATGDIINWLCSDDLLEPNSLFQIANSFIENPSIGLINGGTTLFDDEGTIEIKDYGYSEKNIERYLMGIAFSQPSAYIKRGLLNQTGLLNESLHYCMDYDLYRRLCKITKFKFAPVLFSRYRLHKNSKSVKLSKKFFDEWLTIGSNELLENQPPEYIDSIKHLNIIQSDSIPNNNSKLYNHNPINHDRLQFYFLCYVLKGYYTKGLLNEARQVSKHLSLKYNIEKINEEKEIPEIQSKLKKHSNFMIFIGRKIKQYL